MNQNFDELPDIKAARELAELAIKQGWQFGFHAEEDSSGHPFLKLHLTPESLEPYFQITWHTRATGGNTYRLFSRLVREQRNAPWKDGPSLKAIKARIEGG